MMMVVVVVMSYDDIYNDDVDVEHVDADSLLQMFECGPRVVALDW